VCCWGKSQDCIAADTVKFSSEDELIPMKLSGKLHMQPSHSFLALFTDEQRTKISNCSYADVAFTV